MSATNDQIQQYVDERVRPRCEEIRALLISMEDDKFALDDIYAALTSNPTWVDTRTDAPPHLLTADDVLAWNAFVSALDTSLRADSNLSTIMKACVRPI